MDNWGVPGEGLVELISAAELALIAERDAIHAKRVDLMRQLAVALPRLRELESMMSEGQSVERAVEDIVRHFDTDAVSKAARDKVTDAAKRSEKREEAAKTIGRAIGR